MFDIDKTGSIARKVSSGALLALVGLPLSFLILGWSLTGRFSPSMVLVEQVAGSVFLIGGVVGVAGVWVGWMTIARYRRWATQFPDSVILQIRTSFTVDYYLSSIARNSGGRVTTNAQLGPAGMVVDATGIRIWAGRPSNRLILTLDRDRVISVGTAKVAVSASGEERYPGISIAFGDDSKDSELRLPLDNLSDRRSRLLSDGGLDEAVAAINARLSLSDGTAR